MLKPHHPGNRPQPLATLRPSADIGTYNVEQILEERVNKKAKGKPRSAFLVKWQGYGTEHNSWEPEGGLKTDELRRMITDFRKTQVDKRVTKLTRKIRPLHPTSNLETPSLFLRAVSTIKQEQPYFVNEGPFTKRVIPAGMVFR